MSFELWREDPPAIPDAAQHHGDVPAAKDGGFDADPEDGGVDADPNWWLCGDEVPPSFDEWLDRADADMNAFCGRVDAHPEG